MTLGISGSALAIGAGAAIGGYASYKGAKESSKAQDRATAAQMEGFNLKKPYLSQIYTYSDRNLQDAMNKGRYLGDTYAGMDPRTAAGLDLQYDTALANQQLANNMMDQTSGFVGNAQDLYNLSSQDALADAIDYSTGDQYDALLGAAMRDPYRQLTESTLPQLNNQAMVSGNMNSSRAGMAEAVANRGYQDRVADAGANIQNKLMNQYLKANNDRISNMTTANNNLAGIFGDAYGFQRGLAGDMIATGRAYQADQQAQYNQDVAEHMGDYSFQKGLYDDFQGTMGELPATGQIQPNLYNPSMSAITGALGGAQMGLDLYKGFKGLQTPTTTFTPTFNTNLNPFNNSYYQAGYSGPVGSLYSGGLK